MGQNGTWDTRFLPISTWQKSFCDFLFALLYCKSYFFKVNNFYDFLFALMHCKFLFYKVDNFYYFLFALMHWKFLFYEVDNFYDFLFALTHCKFLFYKVDYLYYFLFAPMYCKSLFYTVDNFYDFLLALMHCKFLFHKENDFLTSYLYSCTQKSLLKRAYPKRKEFAPIGSKFFPFRVDPFSEGRQNSFQCVSVLPTRSFHIIIFLIECWFSLQHVSLKWMSYFSQMREKNDNYYVGSEWKNAINFTHFCSITLEENVTRSARIKLFCDFWTFKKKKKKKKLAKTIVRQTCKKL